MGDELLPRRQLAFGVRAYLYCGGIAAFVGWVFLLVGAPIAVALIANSTFWDRDDFEGALKRAPAVITRVEETSAHTGGRKVKRYDFSFEYAGKLHQGSSYSHKRQSGERDIEVEFIRPYKARIVGMQSRMFSSWVLPIGLFFPIGLGLVLFRVFSGRRVAWLLRRGLPAEGRFARKRKTKMRVNNKPVWRLWFEYDVDGQMRTTSANVHLPEHVESETTRALLYHAHKDTAIVYELLPLRVDLERGSVEIGFWRGLAWVMPLLAVVANGIAFVYVS